MLRGWLDGVKSGFGDQFVAAFEELGVEDTDDLQDIGAAELQILEAGLQGLGAKPLHLKKIRQAILAFTTHELDVSSTAPAPESMQHAEQSLPKSQSHASAEEALQDGAVAEEVEADSDESAIEQASSTPLPDWWPSDPQNKGVAGVPIEEALSELLCNICFQLFGIHRHLLSKCRFVKCENRVYRQKAPWSALSEAFLAAELPFNEIEVAHNCTERLHSRGSAVCFDACEVVESNGSGCIRITLSALLWGHELRRRNYVPTMDPVLRKNCLR